MLAAILFAIVLADSNAPFYTADSIANTAGGVAGLYAPNTMVTIYGQNLSTVKRAISAADISGGMLPTALIGTGVRVLVNSIPADIFYVSPGQINLLIPTLLIAGPATVQVESNGLAGPPVQIMLGDAAPAFFQSDATFVLATHGDYSTVTPDSPARAGEEIALYATGLGATLPPQIPNYPPQAIATISSLNALRVMLNGAVVDPRNIAYAGVVPGYAGLYQVNLVIPPGTPPNPEIRIAIGDAVSPAARLLALQ